MHIFNAIFPVVAIAALGYAIRYFKVLTATDGETMERIAFNFLIPCLLFLGTATTQLPANMDWMFLLAFFLTVLLVYLLSMGIGSVMFGYSFRELSVFGMGGAYSNVTVLGLPITLEILGNKALVPMFIIISVHNLLIFSFGTVVAESKSAAGNNLSQHLLHILQEMLLNPISGSLIAGLVFNLLGFSLYPALLATLEMISRAAIPGAIFALGVALTRYQVRGQIPAAITMVGLKLLVLPALMWLMMTQVFSVQQDWMQTAVVMSCMPAGISVYVFSRRYQSCEAAAAAAIVISSLAAIASITLFTWLLGVGLD